MDNIPFYVKGISAGDIATAGPRQGQLLFMALVCPSGNSVFRLYSSDMPDVGSARDTLRALGCESELSNNPKLVAVGIPGTVPIEPVSAFLEAGALSGRWEYEEGVMRHPGASGTCASQPGKNSPQSPSPRAGGSIVRETLRGAVNYGRLLGASLDS